LWLALGTALALLSLLLWGLSRWSGVENNPALGMLLAAMVGAGLVLLPCGLLLRRRRRSQDASVAHDVSEQVERAVAKRTLGERSRLLSAVAHDLRQPLYAMSLATQSLESQRPLRHPGPLLAQLRSALESADALLDTINTIALLETGAIQPRLSVFSMQAMLERVDRQYGPQARARGLHWTVTPSLERVRTDAVLFERMLGHLISNAVRCTPRGGVLVSCRRRGTHLLIQVWDTGPGLGDAELAAVFDIHYRGQPRSETDNGVGLGLPIVHHAAQLLDIELGVRSRVGHGTCFSLRVPLGDACPPSPVFRLPTA
jgi:signal transduction histidine kinase